VAGEAIVVTEHGHPIARIVPLRPSSLEQLMIEGRATGAEGNVIDGRARQDGPARRAHGQHPAFGRLGGATGRTSGSRLKVVGRAAYLTRRHS